MYKLFLMLRYLRKRRIAYFAISSISLCVAMVLVVHSVMSGFLETVRTSSRNLLGDVILEIGGMESFPYYDEFIAEVKLELGSDILAATPVATNAGLMKISWGSEDRTYLVFVNGIRLHEYVKINSFGSGLFYNKYYPGTTTFSLSQVPLWYWDEEGKARLPDEYHEARARYAQKTSDPELNTLFRLEAGESYPGPGNFWYVPEEEVLDQEGGRLGYFGAAYPGIIVGVDMIGSPGPDGRYERWGFPKGSLVRLTVLSVTRSGAPTIDPAHTAALRYVDDSRTKIYDIDKQAVYCDFGWLQRMLGYDPKEYVNRPGLSPPRASQILIKLSEGVDYQQARDKVDALWQDFLSRYLDRCEPDDALKMQYMKVQTWEDRNSDFIRAVEKERILMLILFAIISLVAIVLVGCIFYMIVQEKTREIGIVKSMGATSRGVAGIFVVYAFGIGVVGSAIGTTIGALFVRYINEFQDFLASLHPQLRVWSPEIYAFDRIPNVVKPFDAVIIVLVAILASMVGSLVAARKASKIWPVDAIRYE